MLSMEHTIPMKKLEMFLVQDNFDGIDYSGPTDQGTSVRSNLAIHLSDTPFAIRQPI